MIVRISNREVTTAAASSAHAKARASAVSSFTFQTLRPGDTIAAMKIGARLSTVPLLSVGDSVKQFSIVDDPTRLRA